MSTIRPDTEERPTDLSELVDAAIAGDAAAWGELVDRYTPLVWRVARSYRLNQADATDIVQITWLRLLENLTRLRDPRAIGGWLRTTARRESLRLCRESGRSAPVAEFDENIAVDSASSLEDEVQRRDRDQRVRTAIRRLPAADRHFLDIMMAAQPASYREMAARLGRPIGSIGPTRARCLTRLQRELSGVGVHDAG
jgi:RNA polymerase sigma factor (sigma-70 family)